MPENELSILLPCPCCGSSNVALEHWQSRKGFEASVSCNNGCLLTVSTITYDTEEEAVVAAISTWNKRPDRTAKAPALCKKCLNFDSCPIANVTPTRHDCSFFKDKSLLLTFPCVVNATVFNSPGELYTYLLRLEVASNSLPSNMPYNKKGGDS